MHVYWISLILVFISLVGLTVVIGLLSDADAGSIVGASLIVGVLAGLVLFAVSVAWYPKKFRTFEDKSAVLEKIVYKEDTTGWLISPADRVGKTLMVKDPVLAQRIQEAADAGLPVQIRRTIHVNLWNSASMWYYVNIEDVLYKPDRFL